MILDSGMSFAAALAGTEAPPEVIGTLRLLTVRYYSFDGRLHQGQLLVHRDLAQDLADAFALMQSTGFPVAKAVPLVSYQWSDERSMADNNSSAFNYRFVAGTARLSLHAAGRAVDINPRQNPVFYENGSSAPPGASYDPAAAGTLHADSPLVRFFTLRGWRWGGTFPHVRDNHHLEKPPPDGFVP